MHCWGRDTYPTELRLQFCVDMSYPVPSAGGGVVVSYCLSHDRWWKTSQFCSLQAQRPLSDAVARIFELF
jgi:hypothetical protein